MTLVILIGVLYAMIVAAFLTALALYRDWRAAFAAGGAATGAAIIVAGIWLSGANDPDMRMDEATSRIVLISTAVVAMTALCRWRVRPASLLKSVLIALVTAAAMAGSWAAGVALATG